MPVKGVFAEAIVSFDPLEPWITVFAGAQLGDVTRSFRSGDDKKAYYQLRKRLEEDAKIVCENWQYILIEDYSFENYSEAACVIAGNSRDGNTA